MDNRKKVFLVFLVSTLMLALELLQTRIFSVIYWSHLVYFVITMALLGIAASGTLLSVSPWLRSMEERKFLSLCLLGFSVSSLLGIFVITETSGLGSSSILHLVLSYLLTMVPFFFFGLLIAGSFLRDPERSGQIYFGNLLGSAAGCVLYLALIGPLGAAGLLLLIFFGGALPGLLLLEAGKRKGIIALLFMAWGVLAARTIEVVPEANKQYWSMVRDRVVEFSQWNAISRVDVVSERGSGEIKAILIDGDAQTPMFRTRLEDLSEGRAIESHHREVVYLISKGRGLEDVLVIGSGGGADVLTAYKNGARRIDAVEINPTTAEVVRDRFSGYIGDIFRQENVKLHVEDGRSFVRRTGKRYDAIMIFAVDSLAALSSGAYVMAENYLYTMEAFSDYWNHLKDGGVLQISRWHYPNVPREELRAFVMAYDTISGSGVSEPWKHLLVVADRDPGTPLADILVSKSPFSEKEVRGLSGALEEQKTGFRILYSPFMEGAGDGNPFSGYVDHARRGEREVFLKSYFFNIYPVRDDNPFFFQYGRWSHVLKTYPSGTEYYDSIQGKWPFFVILSLTAQSMVLVTLLVWAPFLRLRKEFGGVARHAPIVLYFSLLGVGFMFVEMALIQELVLLLGHPMYSIGVTIPTILVSAGLGSLFSGLVPSRRSTLITVAVLGICAFLVIWTAAGAGITGALLSRSIAFRVTAAVLLVSPAGFLMGIPFPSGIRSLSGHPRLIPIAWAANGGMSVMGSVVAIMLAMTAGFSSVIISAAVLYAAALILFVLWERGRAGEGT